MVVETPDLAWRMAERLFVGGVLLYLVVVAVWLVRDFMVRPTPLPNAGRPLLDAAVRADHAVPALRPLSDGHPRLRRDAPDDDAAA
jgi:hypothetical protein